MASSSSSMMVSSVRDSHSSSMSFTAEACSWRRSKQDDTNGDLKGLSSRVKRHSSVEIIFSYLWVFMSTQKTSTSWRLTSLTDLVRGLEYFDFMRFTKFLIKCAMHM
uniref:Uncharacterized protein n=1 Tax=Cacopsylla melanoneura TaxID=428564 RepID=A0A8D8T0N4_9HEMI